MMHPNVQLRATLLAYVTKLETNAVLNSIDNWHRREHTYFHLSKILNEWNPLVKLYENSLKVLEILRVFQLVPNKMPCNKRSQKPTLAEHGRVELPAPNRAVKMCGQLNPPARDEIREEVREG